MAKRKLLGELSPEERRLIEAHLDVYPPKVKKVAGKPGQRSRPLNLGSRARRGTVEVDGSVDLHGKTVDEAWRAVDHFLVLAQTRRWSIVRVITGKGSRSEGGRGVLIDEIPRRLRGDSRVAEVIQAVKPRDGGEGAWFVRLRR